MSFTLLLAIFVLAFIFAGFLFGAIHTLGSLIGLVFGLIVAGSFSDDLAPAFRIFFGGNEDVARLVMFIVIFVAISRLIGYVIHVVDKGAKFLRFIPFVTTIDRFVGAGLGLIEAVLVLGTVLIVASNFSLPPFLDNGIAESWLAKLLMWGARVLAPLLPGDLRSLTG